MAARHCNGCVEYDPERLFEKTIPPCPGVPLGKVRRRRTTLYVPRKRFVDPVRALDKNKFTEPVCDQSVSPWKWSCPLCGAPLSESKTGMHCSNAYRDGCPCDYVCW